MKLKTFIAAAFIAMCGSYAFAQSANFTKVADKKTSVKVAGAESKYVVSIEEAAKMRLDAARETENGWKKIDWKAFGINLSVPREFEFTAHRDDKSEANWRARRWQSRLPQPNNVGYEVWISVEDFPQSDRKSVVELLDEEEKFLNITEDETTDVSDLPPIVRLKLNGVDGISTRWEIPNNIVLNWTSFRIYNGKLQKILVHVSGREEVMTGMRKILQSIKVER